MKKHGGYPQSEAFDLAPNAQITGDQRMKHMAESHAQGMDFGIGKVTDNAIRRQMGDLDYSQEPQSNGSMNYDAIKKKSASMDAKKLRRTHLTIADQ